MANDNGTSWCPPGEGATAETLFRAARLFVADSTDLDFLDKATTAIKHVGAMRWNDRTNLRLTGRPLVAYDLERIAACEVTR